MQSRKFNSLIISPVFHGYLPIGIMNAFHTKTPAHTKRLYNSHEHRCTLTAKNHMNFRKNEMKCKEAIDGRESGEYRAMSNMRKNPQISYLPTYLTRGRSLTKKLECKPPLTYSQANKYVKTLSWRVKK